MQHKTFVIFSLFWIILGWLGFILALLGFFWSPIFQAYLMLGAGILIYLLFRKKISIEKDVWIVASFILLFVAIFSFFATPTIFSGRDQGSISEAAIRLSQNNNLEFSTPTSAEFFKIYGPGKALNFPGFYYLENGDLATQFPVPYIAWLAIFYSILGTIGFFAANAVLFSIFAFSFYFLIRFFSHKKYALLGLFLIFTSFSISWFFKFTLSENLALALLWFAILELVVFLKRPCGLDYYSLLATLALLSFSRIEGFFFLLATIIIIYSVKNTRRYILQEKRWRKIIFPLAIFAAIFLLDIEKNMPFWQEMGKALLRSGKLGAGISILSSEFRTLKIFCLYGITTFLIVGFIGILYFFKKKNWEKLVPFLVVFPTFIYLIDANISADHPWMLRRFVFSILPALIFYSSLAAAKLWQKTYNKSKLIPLVFTALLFIPGLPAFIKYAPFSENKNLLQETAKISQNFMDKDLILVDQLASGDGWAMISGPMNFVYKKDSAYFFNTNDLGRIDTSKFNKIYLITPQENINFWRSSNIGNRLTNYKNYTINTTRLDIADEDAHLPKIINQKVNGEIFEIAK